MIQLRLTHNYSGHSMWQRGIGFVSWVHAWTEAERAFPSFHVSAVFVDGVHVMSIPQ